MDLSLDWSPDEYQKKYLNTLKSALLTFVDAPSGTGKTTLALLAAFRQLNYGAVQRVVYLRFPDDRSLKLGFLPGTQEQKEAPLFGPFYNSIEEMNISEATLGLLKAQGQVHLTTDANLRGVNLKNTFLVVDEAQNARTIDDLHLVLTRLHDSSRAAILGHSSQRDNRSTQLTKNGLTPFQAFTDHMTKKPWAAKAILVNNYRGEISQWADKIWEVI